MASSTCSKPIFTSPFPPPLSSSSCDPTSSSKSSNLSFLRTANPPISLRLTHSLSSRRRARSLSVNGAVQTAGSPSEARDLDDAAASSKSTRGWRPTILVSEKLGEAGLEVLRGFGEVECAYDMSPEELCARISSCDALIVRSGTKVDRRVFEAAQGRLKVVGRAGVGIDNVDLQAATEFGCLVVNAPTANTVAAAEHAIALLTAMARNVSQADASIKAGMCFYAQNYYNFN